PRCRSPHLPDSAERLQGGRLLRRPQQDYPAATVVEYCSAVLKNAATRFLLQGSTYAQAVENKILDYSGFVLDLLKSVRNNKPHYSEVFIDSPLGLGVARLVVDPFSYWINTSAPNEVAAFDALIRAGRSPLEAVCELAGVDPAQILPSRSGEEIV
ncbi:hypothetical protein OSJ57_26355, partial [Sphingomonas sp. HH69]